MDPTSDGTPGDVTGVPADFPWLNATTLPGAAPKFNAVRTAGGWEVGMSVEERAARHGFCSEYVQVLPAYCLERKAAHVDRSESDILERVGRGLAQRHGRLSGVEIDWIVREVAWALGWPWARDVLWRGRAQTPKKDAPLGASEF
jgi:hypothetical protein